MGTLTGQNIIDRAREVLQDTYGTPGTRWPDAWALTAINDTQRDVAVYLPSACVKRATPTAQAGTRQTLAGLGLTDGVKLLDVPRNFASNGTTPGRAITPRPRQWIDAQRPNWHADTAADAEHYFFEPEAPTEFYVWPPASGTKKLEVRYYARPADLASLASAIDVDDLYFNAMVHGVIARAFMRSAPYTANPQLAQLHWQYMLQALGVLDASKVKYDPNRLMVADGAGQTSVAAA